MLDWLTTQLFLLAGHQEANPLVNGLNSQGFLLLKLGGIALLVLGFFTINELMRPLNQALAIRVRLVCQWCLLMVNTLLALTCVWNLTWLLETSFG